MTATKKAAIYAKWRKEPVWRLLAADNADVILGILQSQLAEHDRTLPSSIFHGNRTTDVQTHYMVAERTFDIKTELADFQLDIRKLKQQLVELYHADKFKPYSEHFRRLLHIDSEMTLKLLHKTQSAKNLGDLNLFLREYMLDEPETFSVTERLVTEFAELDMAHQAVITAREQVQLLSQAREHYSERQRQELRLNELAELLTAIDPYQLKQYKILLQQEINNIESKLLALTAKEQQQQELLDQQNILLKHLEKQHFLAGGEQIINLQSELARAEKNKQQRLDKRTSVSNVCKNLGLILPETPEAYAELITKARDTHEKWQQINTAYEMERDTLRDQYRQQSEEFTQIRQEIESLKQQPSNIPASMLALRQRIANKLGLQQTDLPFAGELIEVAKDAAKWRGSIERVLHSFALSLLVDERYYNSVSKFINDEQLGARLVYYRVYSVEAANTILINNSLFNKLILKQCSYTAWLEAELKRRFNYACVESLLEFRTTKRAITLEGQIRHNETQHEKDDRYHINDRKHWVLGFDNREKLQVFEERAALLASQLAALDSRINAMQEAHTTQWQKAMYFQSIVNIAWHEIDVASVLQQINSLEQQLNKLQQGNTALQQLAEQLERQEKICNEKQDELRDTNIKKGIEEEKLKEMRNELAIINDTVKLTPFQYEQLSERFNAQNHLLTLNNIQEIASKVERNINKEKEVLEKSCLELKNIIEKIFQQFKNQWPQDSAETDASIFAAAEFFAKLVRIEHDGLPAYEDRFFNMLHDQSMQNLVSLNTYLSQARKDIVSRMELVNESLAAVEYSHNPIVTYLEIEVLDKQLEEVKIFRSQIREIINYAWDKDKELAEKNFAILRAMVTRLNSQAPDDQRWRQQVLDVRQHVEFIAKEYDKDRNEIEIHRSGSGKSGGQREKLATTCLAAALCYQLGGQQGGIPLYAPVILDEAFSKADNEFTQEVMNIFTNFGFQMIVATPLKAVMTLESFIGGACFIDIAERKHSGTLQILYNHAEKRLDLPSIAA